MELHHFAERILHADTLSGKLWLPEGGLESLTDEERAAPVAWSEPSRPPELQIASKDQRIRMPSPTALDQPEMRVRTLHTFANHELMALELMAWALLAYPDAPTPFRRGLARILHDEQRHLQLYIDRIAAHGAAFGDLPVNDHFFRIAPSLTTPLRWVCAMNLTFEQANLDHAPAYEAHFRRVGDDDSAALMATIAADEVHHVGFGAWYLREQTPAGASTYDVYAANLTAYTIPSRARGPAFDAAARRRAGLDDDFVRRIRG